MSSIKKTFKRLENPEAKKLFLSDYFQQNKHQIRIGLLISTLIYLVFYFIDIWVFPELEPVLLINRIIICSIFLGFFALSFTHFFERHLQLLLLLFGSIATVGILWKLHFLNQSGYDFSFFYPGLILTTSLVIFYLRLRFFYAVILNLISIVFYSGLFIIFLEAGDVHDRISIQQTFVNSMFFLVCSSFLSCYGAYYLEVYARREFSHRHQLESLNEKLDFLVKQRTTELEEEKQKNIRILIEGQEKERERIANELHDSICNQLAVLKLDLEHQIQINDFSGINNSLESILKINREVRDISHNHSTYNLQKRGLVKAVEDSVIKLSDNHNIRFNLHFHDVCNNISKTTELMLYRVIQESINNILKHSAATEVDIQLLQCEHELCLTIYDNGRGFNKDLLNGSGMGLHNMRLRIEQQCRGELHVDSTPDHGTTIIVNLKCPKT